MDNNNELDEDTVIVIGLYNQYQQLRSQQVQKVLEKLSTYKEQILIYFSKIYGFLNKLLSLLPHDNKKLKKKSDKYQWIKIYIGNSKMQYMIHEDYCTYIIYNKIPIPNPQYIQQQLQIDILSEFQDQIVEYINKINQKFVDNMQQSNEYSQNYMQQELDNFQYYQMIENLSQDINDVLTSQELQDIDNYMGIVFQQIITKELQKIADLITNSYKDFISNTEIEPNQYPQEFSYNNYGNGLVKDMQEKLNQVQKNQDINELQIGVYYIQVKKSIIILEIKKDEKHAYLINYFHHYKNKSSIFQKLSHFKIWRIKTIQLSVEEAYALIKSLKKANNFKQLQNQIIEIYNQQDFKEINNQLELQINQHNQIQQEIQKYISKIIPNSNNYKDIYSLDFIQQLQQQKNFDFDLLPIKEFDFDLKELIISTQILGAILINKQNVLCGVVIYPNQNQIIVYLKNNNDIIIDDDNRLEHSQLMNQNKEIIINLSKFNQNNQDQIDVYLSIKKKKQDQTQIIIQETNIKEISIQVAQFYVSLLINKAENNVSKKIKDFLELKSYVWNSILQYLE